MRMRQSIAEIENAFVDEIEDDRERRERLRKRSQRRQMERLVPSGLLMCSKAKRVVNPKGAM